MRIVQKRNRLRRSGGAWKEAVWTPSATKRHIALQTIVREILCHLSPPDPFPVHDGNGPGMTRWRQSGRPRSNACITPAMETER